jgi:hypothetical protein
MQDLPEALSGPIQINQMQETMKAESQLKGAANWFFWLAGLSLVNSAILLLGGGFNFVIGLGITQVIDGIAVALAKNYGSTIQVLAFAVNAGIAGLFVLFGVLGRKKQLWPFIVGMVLYALDGLIFHIF